MRKILAIAALCTALTGCMNLWTRNPFTYTEITSVYQSSRIMAGSAVIVAFPQMMSDCPGDGGFMLENIFTIPLGCLVLCDAACEAVVDTAFLPFDWPMSAYRRKEEENRRHE